MRKGAVGTTDDGITGSLRDGSIGQSQSAGESQEMESLEQKSSLEKSKESDTASRKKEEVKEEHHSSEEDEEEKAQKRNPDTVCHNPEFARRLRERSTSPKIDYLDQHI